MNIYTERRIGNYKLLWAWMWHFKMHTSLHSVWEFPIKIPARKILDSRYFLVRLRVRGKERVKINFSDELLFEAMSCRRSRSRHFMHHSSTLLLFTFSNSLLIRKVTTFHSAWNIICSSKDKRAAETPREELPVSFACRLPAQVKKKEILRAIIQMSVLALSACLSDNFQFISLALDFTHFCLSTCRLRLSLFLLSVNKYRNKFPGNSFVG